MDCPSQKGSTTAARVFIWLSREGRALSSMGKKTAIIPLILFDRWGGREVTVSRKHEKKNA